MQKHELRLTVCMSSQSAPYLDDTGFSFTLYNLFISSCDPGKSPGNHLSVMSMSILCYHTIDVPSNCVSYHQTSKISYPWSILLLGYGQLKRHWFTQHLFLMVVWVGVMGFLQALSHFSLLLVQSVFSSVSQFGRSEVVVSAPFVTSGRVLWPFYWPFFLLYIHMPFFCMVQKKGTVSSMTYSCCLVGSKMLQ
jgi:hypothetical protein